MASHKTNCLLNADRECGYCTCGAEELAAARAAEVAIGNLLARIHRDGGHHTERVGLEQSCKDAEARAAKSEKLAHLALLAHKAPSFDVLPPTFGDDMAKACDEFEATP